MDGDHNQKQMEVDGAVFLAGERGEGKDLSASGARFYR